MLRNTNFGGNKRLALLAFLKKFKEFPWLQRVDDRELLDRISLILAWGGELGVKTPLCGLGKWLCHDALECPLCRHRYKAKPLVYDYAQVHARANFHYAVTLTFTCDPKRAGVWFVTSKREVKGRWKKRQRRYNPFANADKGEGLRIDDDRLQGDSGPVAGGFRACYEAVKGMVGTKLFDGAVVNHEIAWHFMRNGVFDPHLTPHAHAYANRAEKLSFQDAMVGYAMLVQACCEEWMTKWEVKRHRTLTGAYQSLGLSQKVFPMLHIERLHEAEDVRRWIYYSVKCHKFVAEYKRAIAAGVSPRDLNDFMRYELFQGGTTILSAANSPRRFGNLKFRADKADKYIGDAARAFNRKTARRKKRKNVETPSPSRRPPSRESPVMSEMQRQARDNLGVEATDEAPPVPAGFELLNGSGIGPETDPTSGPSPPPCA